MKRMLEVLKNQIEICDFYLRLRELQIALFEKTDEPDLNSIEEYAHHENLILKKLLFFKERESEIKKTLSLTSLNGFQNQKRMIQDKISQIQLKTQFLHEKMENAQTVFSKTIMNSCLFKNHFTPTTFSAQTPSFLDIYC